MTIISIHAPTRGATIRAPGSHPSLSNFNPRSHERSDGSLWPSGLPCAYFNPRSHERSDSSWLTLSDLEDISIHAPTRGATQCHDRLVSVFCISIHAPTRGATQFPGSYSLLSCISIHAPTRGATTNEFMTAVSVKISIHAPTRGATILSAFSTTFSLFQSTLPREERRVFPWFCEP